MSLAVPATSTIDAVLAAWRAAGPERWFAREEGFDRLLRERFLDVQAAAADGRLAGWEETPSGALALVLALDQFPRNMFRGTPRAFASDAAARAVSRRAIARGFDRAVEPELRPFFYLPFMHSEAAGDQDYCVRLYETLGSEDDLRWARGHRDIIARFGRFPHRNAVLGRPTTEAEQAFLDDGGFAG
ncbi:DUF924 family protein [Chelatococcus reniformis]|uniref:DUF924 domain-containing protein n=1 Tax=Chelatococcus reniformis TaxID=1494448 RepID=A0A916UX07_9HYPH|nr:DUF924 family protein [Chelatococcus reniformis]GGC90921.1 hypothetical protein GCM10010994_55890 [Chelatococcus reniformis]